MAVTSLAMWGELTPATLKGQSAPDLQELIERAGRRYAAPIGEEYIEASEWRPIRAANQHITQAEWADFGRAIAAGRWCVFLERVEWRARRRLAAALASR
jgi:hypothetical protein